MIEKSLEFLEENDAQEVSRPMPFATLELLEKNLEAANELRRLFRDLETDP